MATPQEIHHPVSSIAVIGAVSLDLIVRGLSRWPSTAESLHVQPTPSFQAGGMAFNAYAALRTWQSQVHLYSKWGSPALDIHTKLLHDVLRDTSWLREIEQTSICAPDTRMPLCQCFVQSDVDQLNSTERSFIYYPGERTAFHSNDLNVFVEQGLADHTSIFFAGIGTDTVDDESLAFLTALATFVRDWKSRSGQSRTHVFAIDLAPHCESLQDGRFREVVSEVFACADYVIMSRDEANWLTDGDCDNGIDAMNQVRQCYPTGANKTMMIIKDGKNGVIAGVGPSSSPHHFPVEKLVDDVVDPTGAGDIWCAAFLKAASQSPIYAVEDAMQIANRAAAFSLQGVGGNAHIASWNDVRNAMD